MTNRRKVLFALELGAGWGHVGVIQPLASALAARGHEIAVATPQLDVAAKLLQGMLCQVVASPALGPREHRVAVPRSFADVLLNTCFNDALQIAARCASWQALFAHLRPDIIVCDHAPAALLAARTTTARIIPLGQGFTLPDHVQEFPDWRPELAAPPRPGLSAEKVLELINHWLAGQGCPRLDGLSDLYHATHAQVLATIPELDCYGPRQKAASRYFGIWPAESGAPPDWPNHGGKRVLAYVRPFASLGVLLQQLQRLRAASLIVCPGIDPKLADACAGTRVRVTQEPIDLRQATKECDLAIGNGTHGFLAQVLLSGTPQLMIPSTMEQRLNARQVQRLGAGCSADHRQPKNVVLQLRKLWEKESFANAAVAFRQTASNRAALGIDDAVAAIAGD